MSVAEDLLREKRDIETEFGPWTAHNIALAEGVFTMAPGMTGDEVKLRRIVQVVADLCGGQLAERRVLDLACLEGMYALEFAAHGAHVCAIEGRRANLAKAQFAARALSRSSVEFHRDDVRRLDESRYGRFDIVLCLGILYHLDVPDVFAFLERVHGVCDHAAVIDTHVALEARESVEHRGRTYHGRSFREHDDDASGADKESALWASLDNPHSFEFTRPSLYNLLADVGFTSVYECQVPQEPDKPATRATFVAIRGRPHPPTLTPQLADEDSRRLPEAVKSEVGTGHSGLRGAVRAAIPSPLRRIARALVGSR